MYKVLVVEDEDIIRKGLCYTVKWNEWNCTIVGEACNGIEGLEQMDKLQPDILLVDINMPIMNGIELLKKIWKKYSYTAIVLSGYAEFKYAQEAMKYGACDYLLKPLKRIELKSAVERAIEECDKTRQLKLNRQENQTLDNKRLIQELTRDQKDDEIVGKMLRYIEEHYSIKVTMPNVVKEMNYSDTFLNNKFKKKMGMTFNEYLNRYRIQKSMELLKNGRDEIQDIAWKCGIGDYKYFNTVFRKYIGCSPKEFRLRMQEH